MAQHVIKRTLYVGLGGTGMAALLNTKKMFVDTYGEVPPMIGFLGLDTDGGAYNKFLLSKKSPSGRVVLEQSEQLPITVEKAMEIYNYDEENLGWLPKDNLKYLTSMTLGAGQVRSNGRFAFTVNRDKIVMRVRAILDKISNAIHDESKKYRPSDGDDVEIAIVFSVCGGTGCGTFINTAYLLKEVAPSCKISGYAVLPNVFRSMLKGAGAARIAPNAYGAIRDLDYLMSLTGTPKCPPFEIQYLDCVKAFNTRPFDAVFFIDNRNVSGAVYSNLDKLTEMISLALVTSSGALASESASVSDNVSKEISEGNFNVDDKVAWASGMGACEIKISHETLEEIYSLKAAQYLVDQMSASTEDSDALARTWIDSAKIRENDGNDQLIDRLIPDYMADGVLDIDRESPQVMIDAYMLGQRVDQVKLNEREGHIYAETIASFDKYIGDILSRDGGLKTASNVITHITSQVDIMLDEMKAEHGEFTKLMTADEAAYKTAVEDLNKYMGKLFKRESAIQQYCDDAAEAVKKYVTDLKEDARRVTAITFFSRLKVYLSNWAHKVDGLGEKLNSVYKLLSKEVSIIENRKQDEQDNTSFTIDLTSRCINKLTLNKGQLSVTSLSATLAGGVAGLAGLECDDIYDMIVNYTAALSSTQEFSEFTIDDVFANLSEEEFIEVIQSAIRKSAPLFRFDYHGRRPVARGVTGPNDIYYIGVPNKDNNRLMKNNSQQVPYFESCIKGDPNIQFASIGLPDRVIISRQLGVVPAYTIDGLFDYEAAYAEEKCKCYIDEDLNLRMEQIGFTMKPQKANDNRESDQFELWILACIFNLIRNVKGQYQIKCSKGKMLDDGWYTLGTYRNMAFDEFKRIYKEIKVEIEMCINNELKVRGKQATDDLLERVKENYMDDQYCHLYLDRRTLQGLAYKPVAEMIEKELQMVKDLKFD